MVDSACAGPEAVVPDLRGCIEPAVDWWQRVVDVCASLLVEDTVLVGHSGAGVALPSIVAVGPVSQVVFVDALMPARAGPTAPSERIRGFVASLPHEANLPRWSEWWSPDEMASLVQNPFLRQQIIDGQPRVPADFYDHAVPVPSGWDDGVRCRYVRFSPAYDAAAADAAGRGWPVVDLPGTHLHQVDHPEAVVRVLRS